MTKEELKPGDHFWAKLDDKLVAMMLDHEGDYLVCGGWECSVRAEEFEFIEMIPLPNGYSVDQLYYLLSP
jgi:hypothetical protein